MKNADTSVDVYERLADAMDALPSGFTRTPSKLEIELIKIVFTHEEASLAGQLTRTPETAAEIAKRVGLDEEKVTVLLESMIPPRKVRADTLALESGVKGLGKIEANTLGDLGGGLGGAGQLPGKRGLFVGEDDLDQFDLEFGRGSSEA